MAADVMAGELSQSERRDLADHLLECSDCKAYACGLEEQDQQLTGYFAYLRSNLGVQEESVVNALRGCDSIERPNLVSCFGRFVRSSLTRYAATAALIVSVTLCTVVTLVWISHIRECMQLSFAVLELAAG